MDTDYFHPHVMLRFLKDDFQTYLRAVEYFHSISLSPGDIIGVGVNDRTKHADLRASKKLPKEEEYRLLWSIIADQHELCHYHQFISTSFGINYWFLDALYWDYMREFAGKLYLYFSELCESNRPETPLLADLEQ